MPILCSFFIKNHCFLTYVWDVSFDLKRMEFAGVFIFKTKNQMTFSVFLQNYVIFEDKDVETNVWADFWLKNTLKKIHLLKLESYHIYRKTELIIRRIFTPVVMPLNFIHFLLKVGFKSSLGSLTSLSWRLLTALREN